MQDLVSILNNSRLLDELILTRRGNKYLEEFISKETSDKEILEDQKLLDLLEEDEDSRELVKQILNSYSNVEKEFEKLLNSTNLLSVSLGIDYRWYKNVLSVMLETSDLGSRLTLENPNFSDYVQGIVNFSKSKYLNIEENNYRDMDGNVYSSPKWNRFKISLNPYGKRTFLGVSLFSAFFIHTPEFPIFALGALGSMCTNGLRTIIDRLSLFNSFAREYSKSGSFYEGEKEIGRLDAIYSINERKIK